MPPDIRIPVLITHYGEDGMRGSERQVLDLLARLDASKVQPILWCNGAELAEGARALGVPTYRSTFAYYLDAGRPAPNPLRWAGMVRQGHALVRRHGIRVLHASSAAPAQWLLPVARWDQVPLLVHLHIPYLRRSRFVLGLRFADMLVGVSAEVLAGPLADGVPAERTRVILNGVDFGALDAQPGGDLRAALGLAPETLVLASLGYMVRMKGHDVLLRALALLPPTPSLVLLLAGDGPGRGRLEQLALELGVTERVRFLGQVMATAPVYRAADILVHPSRNEGFGLVLAEAGGFGLPVVASRVGGIPEVVVDGETGLLVPKEDPAALAAALGRLVADPGLRARLGQAARARCRALFDVRRMAAGFTDLYAELTGQATAAQAGSERR